MTVWKAKHGRRKCPMRCKSGDMELGRRKVVVRSFGEMEFVGVEGGFERNRRHFWRRRSSKWRRKGRQL